MIARKESVWWSVLIELDDHLDQIDDFTDNDLMFLESICLSREVNYTQKRIAVSCIGLLVEKFPRLHQDCSVLLLSLLRDAQLYVKIAAVEAIWQGSLRQCRLSLQEERRDYAAQISNTSTARYHYLNTLDHVIRIFGP